MLLFPDNTRFVPTINGDISAGHGYLCLLNEYMAHSSGGRFGVRCDDMQRYWCWKYSPDQISQWKRNIKEDLEWLGIKLDWWAEESVLHAQGVLDKLATALHTTPPAEMFCPDDAPIDVGYADEATYPYVPYYTWAKVLYDFYGGSGSPNEITNLLVRGRDLTGEFALYQYFSYTFGLPRVQHIYIPRLEIQNKTVSSRESVSKTLGQLQLRKLRERGVTPEMVIGALKESCLIDPGGEWDLKNVKKQPIWEGYEWDC